MVETGHEAHPAVGHAHGASAAGPEERVLAQAAEHGLPWRPGHIQYRQSILRWELRQTVVSVRAREDGTLSDLHLDTSVQCASQLSGTPVLSCTFRGAHFMEETGAFHACASERRQDSDAGTMSVCAIPPDETFELVRYVSRARGSHSAAASPAGPRQARGVVESQSTVDSPHAAAALAQTRLPVQLCAFAREFQDGQLFALHVRLRIAEGYTQLRQVRCAIPLHPHCRPGSVQLNASSGRAQVEVAEEGRATGAHNTLVSWEFERVGAQTGNTERDERIECGGEATLDVQCSIAAPLIVFPYHLITAEDMRPACVPAESLAIDQALWQKWNSAVSGLLKLDELKKPFPQDRTVIKIEHRRKLDHVKGLAQSRLASSCLSRVLPPIAVRVGKAFGPCFSGLSVDQCRVHSTSYPGVYTGGDAGSVFHPLVFKQGISNELICAELLFDVHRSDFRPGSTPDFDVPDTDFPVEKERTRDDEPQEKIGNGSKAQGNKAEATKLAANPVPSNTGASKGLLTRPFDPTKAGVKGKVGVAKKKR